MFGLSVELQNVQECDARGLQCFWTSLTLRNVGLPAPGLVEAGTRAVTEADIALLSRQTNCERLI